MEMKKQMKSFMLAMLSVCFILGLSMSFKMTAYAGTVSNKTATSSSNYSTRAQLILGRSGAMVPYTAPYTGVYHVWSSDASGDPYVQIANAANKDRLKSSIADNNYYGGSGYFYGNDDGGSGLNFDGNVFFVKGKTYYVFFTKYSTSSSQYTGNIQYVGASTVTLNRDGGSGGTSNLYGGKYNRNPGHDSSDGWWATSTSSSTASAISIPSRSGYRFEGYYYGNTQVISASGQINHTALTNCFSHNGTITAKWYALQQNYTLNPNGGSGSSYTVTVFQNAALPTRAANTLPTRVGYTFDGYYTSTSGGVKYYNANGTCAKNNDGTVGGTTALYARWIPNTYQVTLDANGGVGSVTVNMTYDQALSFVGASVPSKTGYTFQGYYYNLGETNEKLYISNNSGALANAKDNGSDIKWTHATDGVRLKAKWIPNTYTIRLFSNDDIYGVDGGSGYIAGQDIEATYGDLYLPTADDLGLKRNHYDFVGWNLYDEQEWQMFLPGATYKTGLTSDANGTVNVYAAWKMKDNFSITYNNNGGSGGPRNATVFSGETYTLGDSDAEPKYTNHTFLGWFTSPNGNNETDICYRKGTDKNKLIDVRENITLYARWKANKSVAYNANGGSFDTVMPISYPDAGSTVAVDFSNQPSRIGYEFKGWAKTASAETPNYTEEQNTFTMGDEDVILYAVWEKESYSIDYTVGTGDTNLENLVDITKADGAARQTSVKYQENYQVKVTVDTRKVDATNLVLTINDIAVATPNPVVDTEDSNIQSYLFTVRSVVNNQAVAVTGLAEKEYGITYITNGGGLADATETYKYHANDIVTLPIGHANTGDDEYPTNTISRTGYTFEGWYEDSTFTGDPVLSFSKSNVGDKTFYGKWEPITYTVSYDANIPAIFVSNTGCNTTVPNNMSYTYEESFAIATKGDLSFVIGDFSPEFLGWNTDADASTALYDEGELVKELSDTDASIVTLYAIWGVPNFKVSFDLDGGRKSESKEYATIVAKQGSTVALPAQNSVDTDELPGAPVKDGYTFAGWKDGSTDVTSINNISAHHTVKAQWTPNEYTVTYKVIVPDGGQLAPTEGTPSEPGEVTLTGPSYVGSGTYGTDYTIADFAGYTMKDKDYEDAIAELRTILGKDENYEVTEADITALNYIHGYAKTYINQAIEEIANSEEDDLKKGIITSKWDLGFGDLKGNCYNYSDEMVEALYSQCFKKPDWESVDLLTYLDELKDCDHTFSLPTKSVSTKFVGWTTDFLKTNCKNNTEAAAAVTFVAGQTNSTLTTGETITLYAVFVPENVTTNNYVTYDANGGVWSNGVKSIEQGTGNITLNNDNAPTKTGYSFAGWSLDGSTTVTEVNVSDGNKTVKAIYTPITYTIKYHANDNGYLQASTDRYVPGNAGVVDGSMNLADGTYDKAPSEYTELYTYGESKALIDCPYTSTNNYQFLGWATTEGATEHVYTDKESVLNLTTSDNGVIDFYAVWRADTPMIRFHANGGEGEPSSLYRTENNTYAIPESIPTRTGYIFKGWGTLKDNNEVEVKYAYNTNEGAGSFEPASLTTTAKTILYAVWEESPYCTIRYTKPAELGGNVPIDTTRYAVGDTIDLNFSTTPTKVGYHFDGWMRGDRKYYADPVDVTKGQLEVTVADTETENKVIELSPKMTPNTYTINFYCIDEAETIKTISATYDESISTENLDALQSKYEEKMGDSKDNYNLLGWSLINGGGVTYKNTAEELKNLSVVNEGIVNLYAVTEAKSVEIKINPTGGTTSIASIEATYGELMPPIREIPVRDGYTFAGYYDNAARTGSPIYDASLNVTIRSHYTANTTFYAKWIPKDYNLIYIYEGEVIKTTQLTYKDTAAERKIHMAGSEVFGPGVIVRGATKLYGWSLNGKNEGTVYKVGEDFSYDLWNNGSDIIVYPVIVEDAMASLTYSANGGSGCPVDGKSYQIGDKPKVLFTKIPVRDSYEFLGWSTDPNMVAEDIDDVTSQENFYPYIPNNEEEYEIELTGSKTLYAVWKIGTYDITYEKNAVDAEKTNEETETTITVERGHTDVRHAATIFERSGYELLGWSNSSAKNNAVAYDLGSQIDRPLTTFDSVKLYAVWMPESVILNFNTLTDECTVQDMSVTYDSVFGVLPTPDRVGYTFEGWYTDYDAETGEYSGQITSTTVVNTVGAIGLYAKWSEDIFKIAYYPNYKGASVMTEQYRVMENAILKGEDAFGYDGHNLIGYAISENGPVAYQVGQELGVNWATKGTETKLYCVWDVEANVDVEVGQSYVYYVSNGADSGLAPNYVIASNGNEITVAGNTGNMGKIGYVFVGWNTEPNGTGEEYKPGDQISLYENMKLFAQWERSAYTLSIKASDGIESYTVTPEKDLYTFEESVTISAKVKSGYSWKGFISSNDKYLASYVNALPEDGVVTYTFPMAGVPIGLDISTKPVVKLDANGGKFADESTLKDLEWESGEGFNLDEIPTPEHGEDYFFMGWFTDSRCSKLVTEETIPVGGSTLYAGWGYNASEGEMKVMSVSDVIYNGTALKPSVLVTDGTKILREGVDYTVSYKNNKNVNKDGKFVGTNALILSQDKVDDTQNFDKKLPIVTIKGAKNYSGIINMNFNIRQKDISLGDNDPEIGLFYDQYLVKSAKATKLKVVLEYVVSGGKKITLKDGKDYTVSYIKGTDETSEIPANATGSYTMKITAKEGGSYIGSFTKPIVISEADNSIAAAKITAKTSTLIHDMTGADLSLTVKLGKAVLTAGTDYNVEFSNGTPTKPGTYNAIVSAADGSGYVGSKSVKVILKAANLKSAEVKMITNAAYTGENYGDGIVSIIDGGRVLTKGVDYTTSYKSGEKAGKVDVVITGLGIYNGSVRKVKYNIAQYDLAVDYNRLVSVKAPEAPAEYSRDGAKPEYEVLFAGRKLEEGVDFVATYLNNYKLTSEFAFDKPEIIIKGIGNFTGKISAGTYTIVPKKMTQENMSVITKPLYYKANATLSPKFILKEKDAVKEMRAGIDYDMNHIEYTCNGQKITKIPEAGSVITVKVNGIDNFAGSYTFEMSVAGKDFKTMKVPKITKIYTGEKIELTEADLALTYKIKTDAEAAYFNADGSYALVGSETASTSLKKNDVIQLIAGRDYDLDGATYRKNSAVGKASVTMNGKGFFGGSKTFTFTISKKPLKWFSK